MLEVKQQQQKANPADHRGAVYGSGKPGGGRGVGEQRRDRKHQLGIFFSLLRTGSQQIRVTHFQHGRQRRLLLDLQPNRADTQTQRSLPPGPVLMFRRFDWTGSPSVAHLESNLQLRRQEPSLPIDRLARRTVAAKKSSKAPGVDLNPTEHTGCPLALASVRQRVLADSRHFSAHKYLKFLQPRELKLVSRQPLFGAEASALGFPPPPPHPTLTSLPALPLLDAGARCSSSSTYIQEFLFKKTNNSAPVLLLAPLSHRPSRTCFYPATGEPGCFEASRQRAQTDGGVKSESSLAPDQDHRHNVPSSSQPPNKALVPRRGPVASPNPWPRLGNTKTEQDSRYGKTKRPGG
ncbi:hypothetical protein CRENBAI_009967 [Crenichthys baileyi]|uniref:Uncharacterized protein n=1 Tax=Crenichthys baileyi TaxID=28760 RepID=A0AAV9S1H5_9TELE